MYSVSDCRTSTSAVPASTSTRYISPRALLTVTTSQAGRIASALSGTHSKRAAASVSSAALNACFFSGPSAGGPSARTELSVTRSPISCPATATALLALTAGAASSSR